MTHWTDDERITEVLREARLMFLAVSGPHVTPLAFDHRGDDLATPSHRRTLRTRCDTQLRGSAAARRRCDATDRA